MASQWQQSWWHRGSMSVGGAECRTLLTGYKVPKKILVVDTIPRLDSHKVDRTRVRMMLRDGADPGSTSGV